jgi:hypothetical protein
MVTSRLSQKLAFFFPPAVILLLGLAVAIRIPLLPAVAHLPGNYTDMACWRAWTEAIHEHGLRNIFRTTDANYIGYQYLLWMVSVVYGLISPGFDTPSRTLDILLKAPPLLFDVALVWLVFAVSRRLLRANPHAAAAVQNRFPCLSHLPLPLDTALALAPATLIALHPAVLYDSAVWGQTDSIITFFMLGAIAAIAMGNAGFGLFLWAVGFVIKPQPVFILPILLAFVWWQSGWRGLVRGLLGVSAGLGLMLGYWLAYGQWNEIGNVYHMLFKPEPTLSLQAWNIWWFKVLHGDPAPASSAVAIGGLHLSYSVASILLCVVAALLALIYLRRHLDLTGLLEASAFMAFAFFMLPVSSHERYGYPVFGLLAPVLLVKPRWLFLYIPISATFFTNLYVVAPIEEALSGRLVHSPLTEAVAALNVLMFGFLVAWLTLVSLRPARTQRPLSVQ